MEWDGGEVPVGCEAIRDKDHRIRRWISGGRVFVDFGRNRVYALPEDGEDVIIFGGFLEMFGRLRPRVVVADSYPRKLLTYSSRSMLLRWSLRLGL